MKAVDFLLLFPPNTEARLFPYLSLPYLTSYLQNQGYAVVQRDLNIELTIDIFRENLFLRKPIQSPSDFKNIYRKEMNSFFREVSQQIFFTAFDKKQSSLFSSEQAIRLAKNGIQLILEECILSNVIPSLSKTLELAASYEIEKDEHVFTKQLLKKLKLLFKEYNPLIIGISVSFYSQLLPAFLICRWIKQHYPDVFITLGGRQVMIRHKDLLELKELHLFTDSLCIDQGEEVLDKLNKFLNRKISKQDVPSIVWIEKNSYSFSQKKNEIKINDFPPPIFQGLPLENYLNIEVQLPLITCVGCYWGRCVFCSYGNHSLFNNNYQQLTPNEIANHCEFLINNHKATRINFIDENCNLNLILQAVRELNNRGYKITFSTRNRLEKLLTNIEFCRELAERGCILMSCGYETNSQRLLDKMDKGIKAEYYQKIIDNLDACKIALRLSVMGGLFDETEAEFEASKNFLLKNASKIGIDIMQMLVAEPSTRLSDEPEKYALTITSKKNMRGNEKLNYAHGRMGYTYDFLDKSDFFEKEKRFIEIFHEIIPAKNVDLPPEKQQKATLYHPSNHIILFPWVKVVKSTEEENQLYLLDLQYEKIYKIPNSLSYNVKSKSIRSKSINTVGLIKNLYECGLGAFSSSKAIGSP